MSISLPSNYVLQQVSYHTPLHHQSQSIFISSTFVNYQSQSVAEEIIGSYCNPLSIPDDLLIPVQVLTKTQEGFDYPMDTTSVLIIKHPVTLEIVSDTIYLIIGSLLDLLHETL